MKLQQVVSGLKRLQVASNFKQPKMKLQVVSKFNLANNEATSCFRAQTGEELNY